ncbi:MAG: YncE family protein [Bacteroidota bacterium]|nr:YncE family protein [Bacteroidota bacterium]
MKTPITISAGLAIVAGIFFSAFVTAPVTHAQPHMVYAVLQDEGNLAVVDPEKGRLIQRIQIGRKPDMIALNENDTKVYISNTGDVTVSIVTLSSRSVTQVLRLPVNRRGIYAGPLTRTPDGLKIFVAERSETADEDLRIYVIDTRKELIVRQFDGGKNIAAMSVSYDGGKLFVLNRGEGVSVYDAETCEKLGTVELIAGFAADAAGLACSPTAPKGYITYGTRNTVQAFNTESYKNTATIPMPKYKTGNQTDVVFGRDGRYAFVINRKNTLKEVNGVNVIDAASDTVVKLFNSGVVRRGIMTSPDGKICYIAAEDLKWYNMETLEHIRSISLRTTIAGIAVVNK